MRFSVLTHDHPFFHYDLLLEEENACATWRLLKSPRIAIVEAERLDDHRKHYLDYEGPVSDDRGEVTQWDKGLYEIIEKGSDRWRVKLFGQQLRGSFEITPNEFRHIVIAKAY